MRSVLQAYLVAILDAEEGNAGVFAYVELGRDVLVCGAQESLPKLHPLRIVLV